MTISLIIPVRNEAGSVDTTMAAIMNSTVIPDQIVIADGQSDDDTVEKFQAWKDRHANLKVVENSSRWSGAGRNVGAKHAIGDILIFADSGNPISPDWISEISRPLLNANEIDIVCGVFQPLVESDFERVLAAVHYPVNSRLEAIQEPEQQEIEPEVVLPGGGAIAMRKETFEAIGGYPEWLHRAQDKLFSRKAYALEMKVAVNWLARMRHHMRKTPREVFQLTFDYGRGNGRTLFTNRHFMKLLGFYGLLSGVAAAGAGLGSGLLGLFVFGMFSIYFWHAGIRKVREYESVNGSPGSIGYLKIASVLFPRDLGVLLGHAVGFAEWIFRPVFRKQYFQYMEACDPSRIPHVEN